MKCEACAAERRVAYASALMRSGYAFSWGMPSAHTCDKAVTNGA